MSEELLCYRAQRLNSQGRSSKNTVHHVLTKALVSTQCTHWHFSLTGMKTQVSPTVLCTHPVTTFLGSALNITCARRPMVPKSLFHGTSPSTITVRSVFHGPVSYYPLQMRVGSHTVPPVETSKCDSQDKLIPTRGVRFIPP